MTNCPLCATKHDGPCYQEFRPKVWSEVVSKDGAALEVRVVHMPHNLNRTQNNVMKTEHKETKTGYGVLVVRKDGTFFLASGKDGRFFRGNGHDERKEAVTFKRELEAHLSTKCKVVKLRATWEVIQ